MKNIRKGTYEGYLWRSNAAKPEVILDRDMDGLELDEGRNPFIVEGQLFDRGTQTSYSIRYADGRYYVSETVVTADDALKGDARHFIAHRMEGIGRMLFIQYWDTVEDSEDRLCEGMPTQVPGKLVFCGFERKEDEQ